VKTLGEIVQMARRERGMSLKAFARACGLSDGTIATVEYGGRVRPETIDKLAECLGVPARELAAAARLSGGLGPRRGTTRATDG
jgi:transcriptional regulator with XRE-family HTH domain